MLFDQDLAHEGAPYDDGVKLFLRTELIFESPRMRHEPAIAKLFAQACYLTGESVFEPSLAAAVHELYDRAAAAHWGVGAADQGAPEPWLHKRFRGLDFVSNGHDYWFPRQGLDLAGCATIALCDLLNCKIAGRSFRKLCSREIVEQRGPASAWMPEFLRAHACRPAEPAFVSLEVDLLFPPQEEIDESACCPFHAWGRWDPARAPETVELFGRAQRFAKRRIAGAPIQIMGEEVFVDPAKFVVADGKIHVLSDRALAPLNFAACWNDGSSAENYVGVELLVEAPELLIPPILYTEHEHGVHLMLDLFRNSWMVEHRPRAVPVPRFRYFEIDTYEEGDIETTPWLDAVERLRAPASRSEQDDDEDDEDDEWRDPWWYDTDDPIARELFEDHE